MNIKAAFFSTLLIIGMGLATNCGGGQEKGLATNRGGGQKKDLSTQREICDKIIKCDKFYLRLAKHPMVIRKYGGKVKPTCRDALASFARHESYGQLMPQVMNCLNTAPCEKMDLNGCFATVVKKHNENSGLKK